LYIIIAALNYNIKPIIYKSERFLQR
jgi:hypothetical protein